MPALSVAVNERFRLNPFFWPNLDLLLLITLNDVEYFDDTN